MPNRDILRDFEAALNGKQEKGQTVTGDDVANILLGLLGLNKTQLIAMASVDCYQHIRDANMSAAQMKAVLSVFFGMVVADPQLTMNVVQSMGPKFIDTITEQSNEYLEELEKGISK